MSYGDPMDHKTIVKRTLFFTGVTIVTAVVIVMSIIGISIYMRGVSRTQALKDARNRVKISAVEIQNQEQRVVVAKQQADIRYQTAIGVRRAQDEIAKTLTPLYVQFEMVDALKQIATSGSNNSVVYIPSGANGIPLVNNVAGSTSVGDPQHAK